LKFWKKVIRLKAILSLFSPFASFVGLERLKNFFFPAFRFGLFVSKKPQPRWERLFFMQQKRPSALGFGFWVQGLATWDL
jgi:hypothetical protein